MDIDLTHLNRFPDLNFRLVTFKDAKFIWNLRNHDYKSRHLHSVGATVKDQEEWIKEYKQKESRGEEYYFVISDGNNKKQGLYRIYDIKEDSAEIGSWIFREESPKFMAIRAELMLKEFAFKYLDKKILYFETRKKNKRIYTYSIQQNAKVIGKDDLNYYFQLTREDFKEGKEKVIKLMQIKC